VSDFNGRIHEITHAIERNPDDVGEVRFTIRKVLRAERMDGWQEGYSDGHEDYYAKYEQERSNAERAVQLIWHGTDAHGEGQSGRWMMPREHIAPVVEDRFELGWRGLTVTLDGVEVAGIGPHPEKPGEYLWWEGEEGR